MLRLVLLGLLIPLGVGALAAMEFRTPPRTTVAAVQPFAETTLGISRSHGVLVKADRLEDIQAKSEPPAQPPVVEPISPPQVAAIDAPKAPRAMSRRPRHDPKSRKITSGVRPEPKPKATIAKRMAVPKIQTVASDSMSCRLSGFGGLRKALGLTGCEL